MDYRIAAWELERETCPHHGGPKTECGDDDKDWFPQRHVCHPTAQLEAAKRRYARLHEEKPYHDGSFTIWSEKPDDLHPFHYSDGVTIFLSETDDTPDDDFLGQSSGGGGVFGTPAED